MININEHIKGIETLLRRVIGEDIHLSVVTKEAPLRLRADPAQLEQVIINLIMNARDAMPTGGNLTMEITEAEIDEDYCSRNPDAKPDRFVLIAISDTGCGMSPEILSRLFEPFFTTKEEGKGTGLGLATVYGIVKQSGGHITVYSEVGRGTTFKVFLPLSEGATSKRGAVQAENIAPAHGKETILIVEDEADLRELTKEYLQNRGYLVLDAGGPEQALQTAEKSPQPIDLLLTDVVLPGSSGVALAQRLVSLHPQIKVLYISGYTADAIVHHGAHDSNFAFLSKPFSLHALGQKVRAVLDGEGALAQ